MEHLRYMLLPHQKYLLVSKSVALFPQLIFDSPLILVTENIDRYFQVK